MEVSQINTIDAIASSLFKINFNSILTSMRWPTLPNAIFPSGFPTKTPYVPYAPPISFFLIYHPNDFVRKAGRYAIFFQSPVTSSAPYSRTPQPMFLPQCERPSFTPIQNNTKITVTYSVYINFYILKQQILN